MNCFETTAIPVPRFIDKVYAGNYSGTIWGQFVWVYKNRQIPEPLAHKLYRGWNIYFQENSI